VLEFCERDAATLVGKLLDSAVANASHNDNQVTDELYVSACFADEGRTNKRWRPRARGRATRIRKRTSHITLIVSRLPDDRLARLRARRAAEDSTRRARRVAGGRKASQATQADAREGSRLRRRRGQTAAEAVSDEVVPVEELEDEGIVDQQDAVLDEMTAEDAVEETAVEDEAVAEDDAVDEAAEEEAPAAEEAAEAAEEEPTAEPSTEEDK
jgi:large subunit ribosomal protein L22